MAEEDKIKKYIDNEIRCSITNHTKRAEAEQGWALLTTGVFTICALATLALWYIATFTEIVVPSSIVIIVLVSNFCFCILPVLHVRKHNSDWGIIWKAAVALAHTRAVKQNLIAKSSEVQAELCFNPHLTPTDIKQGEDVLSKLEQSLKSIIDDEQNLDTMIDVLLRSKQIKSKAVST
jgi:hypothetical protein